jgi:hypothetical protein
MGQKVNPIGLRLGINRTWDSRWYAGADYADLLHEDLRIRAFLRKRLQQAGVSRIIIERPAKKARLTIHTARPGVVIGKKGADIERLRGDLQKMTGSEVHLNIVEIRKPEIDATLVASTTARRRDEPPTAVAGSRSGCSRARSWPTTPWPRKKRCRRRSSRVDTAAALRGNLSHVAAKAN